MHIALIVTAAHALWHSADFQLGNNYVAQHPFSGTSKQGYLRTDHPLIPARSCRAHSFARCTQAVRHECLINRWAATQVSPPLRSWGNVPLLCVALDCSSVFVWCGLWVRHRGALFWLWHTRFSHLSGTHDLRHASPAGGVRLGLAFRADLRCGFADVIHCPGGGSCLGRVLHEQCLISVSLCCCTAPGGGIRLGLCSPELFRAMVTVRTSCGCSLVGGSGLDCCCTWCFSISVYAWHGTYPGGGLRLGYMPAEYCRVDAHSSAGRSFGPGGGTRLRPNDRTQQISAVGKSACDTWRGICHNGPGVEDVFVCYVHDSLPHKGACRGYGPDGHAQHTGMPACDCLRPIFPLSLIHI